MANLCWQKNANSRTKLWRGNAPHLFIEAFSSKTWGVLRLTSRFHRMGIDCMSQPRIGDLQYLGPELYKFVAASRIEAWWQKKYSQKPRLDYKWHLCARWKPSDPNLRKLKNPTFDWFTVYVQIEPHLTTSKFFMSYEQGRPFSISIMLKLKETQNRWVSLQW